MREKIFLTVILSFFSCIIFGMTLFLAPKNAQALEELKQAAEFNDGCLRCHGAEGLKMKYQGQIVSLYVKENEYFDSQHGSNKCTTCHSDIVDYPHVGALKGKELKDLVYKNCQRCHANVAKIYAGSAHAKANAAGKEVYCWSCHGTHNILKKENEQAQANKNNIPKSCGGCHDHRIMESYEESFHGKAVLSGSQKSASCADCHGTHDILGPKDPKSPVAKQNIPTTCAKCHYKALTNFANGTEHWVFERGGPGEPMYWTLKFMVWLTVSVITIFFVHVELDLYRRLKNLNKKDGH